MQLPPGVEAHFTNQSPSEVLILIRGLTVHAGMGTWPCDIPITINLNPANNETPDMAPRFFEEFITNKVPQLFEDMISGQAFDPMLLMLYYLHRYNDKHDLQSSGYIDADYTILEDLSNE